ncbi:MAG TPA: SpoIIE family protein phosphatase [Anaerolineales bacterium]|nr:SpoIIE family protein phosphatase [Anaerolineales bacterium]
MQNKMIEMIEWSVAIQAREGEDLSGDHYFVCPGSDHYLVAAVDGVGHGPQAVFASRMAVSLLEANAGRSLPSLVEICHTALRITRGVVMSLAAFNGSDSTMTWLGVGNVQGRLLRADKESNRVQEELFLRSGVVGHNLPSTLDVNVLPVSKGDVLILATDGIHDEFTEGLYAGRSVQEIADKILLRHSNGADDALVLVARVQGGML